MDVKWTIKILILKISLLLGGYFKAENLFTKHVSGSNINKMYEVGADHGTSCAGVIDAELTVDAAPGCRLLPIN
ncbi:hypothetical protein ACT7DM_29915 [Bacillus cereus]